MFLTAASDRWRLHALEGSEAFFRWATLDAVRQWLDALPENFSFQAFPDDTASWDEPGTICAVVIERLRGDYFFGYRGIESFWGGVTSREEVERLIECLQFLRNTI